MKEKKKYALWILFCIIVIIVSVIFIIYNTSPKIDREAMATEIAEYVYGLDNVQDIKADGDSIFKITITGDSWYHAEDKDKLIYCKAVNQTITAICQKYKAIKDTERANVYYYDEYGVLLAEPSETSYTLESNIIH
jgi:hypothetical protein